MTRQAIITRTVDVLAQLPENMALQVSDFATFLMKQYEEQQLSEGIRQITATGEPFDFLATEEDLYTEADLKEKYNG